MQIANAKVDMASTHTRQQQHSVSEALRFWVGRPPAASSPAPAPHPTPANDSAVVSLSDSGRATQSAEQINEDLKEQVDKDPNLNLLRRIMEALTGRKIRTLDLSDLQLAHQESSSSSVTQSVQQGAPATGDESAGYGLSYDYHESYSEFEQTTFSASGTIRTKDGQDIAFHIELSMTRSYHEESNVRLRLGDAAKQTDPLVVNFDGNAAQLQDSRFAFDLDADGRQDRINQLGSGSGFLVFDRNGDGRANDGRELFGPRSGNGFTELAALDSDKNGWIDENDSDYQNLKIWQPDNRGEGPLKSLKDAGIAALSVSSVDTPFDLKNVQNALIGQVRSTGLSINDNGTPGTVQQVDLTI